MLQVRSTLAGVFRMARPALFLLCIGSSDPATSARGPGSHELTPLNVTPGHGVGFETIPPTAAGIHFTNRLAEERSLLNQILLNGSGVAAGDIDGDGLCDLYFCGLDSPNALFRNLGGWRFEEITTQAGVACADQASTGAAFADIDGDGDLDLLVNAVGRGTRLFVNDGRGRFAEATGSAGLASTAGAVSFAIADIDGDGLLDLYVVHYRTDTMRDMPGIVFDIGNVNGRRGILRVNGRPASAPDLTNRFILDPALGVLENGEADALFRNLGNARFERIGADAFLDEQGNPAPVPHDWGLSAMFRDLNGDRAPDLYVCNDFHSPDRLWINLGDGRFRAAPRDALPVTSLFSMGIDFADVDRDGHDDFFVADMLSREHARRHVQVMESGAFAQALRAATGRVQLPRNTLFRSRGDGTFEEIARMAGVDASEWSWCPAFLDVDLDGYEDLLVTTGHWRDAMNIDASREIDSILLRRPLPPREQLRLRRRLPRLDTPNLAFRNRGDLAFDEVSEAWNFDSRRISHGMALADLDNDGDLDVVINCLNEAPLIHRNVSARPRLAVRLRGRPPNTRGIGARVSVRLPCLPMQSQEMTAGGRYLSSDESVRCFAAGTATNRATITVAWRSGATTVLHDIPANHRVDIHEPTRIHTLSGAGASPATPAPVPSGSSPLFDDVSHLVNHSDSSEPFDDFERQPLLPAKLSDAGPPIAWFDFNADGRDDLFIGPGAGARPAVFRNAEGRAFIPQRSRVLQDPLPRASTAIAVWHPDGHPALLLALSNWEHPEGAAPALRAISMRSGEVTDFTPAVPISPGAIAVGDPDSDGDLDVFLGARTVGARFPAPAPSYLLLNHEGALEPHEESARALAGLGRVTDALFTDLDDDRHPELVVATQWGAIRIFSWGNARLEERDPYVRAHTMPGIERLSDLTGWWNSIAAGDFDNDGRTDLVAGNRGRNTRAHGFLPVGLAFTVSEDLHPPGLLEHHFDSSLRRSVPVRPLSDLITSFPALAHAFPTHAAFGAASRDALHPHLPEMRDLAAAWEDSVVLLNRGDFFEVRSLPHEAQVAPVFGIAAADFDNDGNHDLVLAQNQSGNHPMEGPWRSGAGVFLRGDGKGAFEPWTPTRSGIRISEDARAVAPCDFDQDGRLDLAITSHRGPTRLYRNRTAEPGLRVRLNGPTTNPHAIGARARLIFRDGSTGPAGEIRIGGGHHGQAGREIVLGGIRRAGHVEIVWPGGRREMVALTEAGAVPGPDGDSLLLVRDMP